MLAAIRPDSWNLPLFLHVLGATLLFGTTATLAIAGFAERTNTEHSAFLARLVFRTFLIGVVPSFILMRVGAGLIANKEFPDKTPGWVNIGFVVSEPGAILLLIVGILAWFGARKQGLGRAAFAVPILASIYVVALGVAWFAMSAKPS
jgi:hypothetical protein